MRKILALLALLLATPAAAQNYQATAGSGLTFGSKFVSSVNYPQFVFCDPTTPSQCVGVNASGQMTVLLGAGSAIVGKVGIDQTTPGTTNGVQVNAALPAGTNIIGKFGIDQTTPGTTNLVAAGQNGTWNITNVSGTVSLPTGAATSANQTNASQKTQIVDGSGNVIASTSNNLNVQCANCSGSGASAADAATFTAGSSTFAPAGGEFTSGGATACVTGHQCLVGITAARAFFTDLSSQAGTAITSAPSAYGTAPTGNVIGVNAFVTGAVGLAAASTTSGQTGSLIMSAVTATNPSYTTAQTNYVSSDVKGNTRVVLGGGVPETASATGTTAATTATLATSASTTTYICGFSIRANATAAATGNATVTGTITGTLNYTQWTAPNASGLGVTEEIFTPCIPASAANTSIAVVSAAPGTGGVVSVTAWGYQQ